MDDPDASMEPHMAPRSSLSNLALTAGDTTDATATNTPSTPKKPLTVNFPIPRELRNEIYSYLLHPDAARYCPPTPNELDPVSKALGILASRVYQYRFQTQICRVNKTIGGEATDYFYDNNAFVAVNYCMPSLRLLLRMSGIPTIAEDQIELFDADLCKLDITWEESPEEPNDPRMPELQAAVEVADTGNTFIIHSHDFARLCDLLQFECQSVLPEGVFISSQRGNPALDLWITGSMLRIEKGILDDADDDESETCSAIPDIIWPRALQWERLEVALRMKKRADRLALAGQFNAAKWCYFLIERRLKPTANRMTAFATTPDPECEAAEMRIKVLRLALLLSWTAISLKQSDTRHHIDYGVLELRECINTTTAVTYQGPIVIHCEIILFADLLARLRDFPTLVYTGLLARYAANLRLTTLLCSVSKLDETDEHVACDMTVIVNALKNISNKTALQHGVLLDQMSVHTMPFRIYDFQADCLALSRPEDLEGWQDKTHLSAMTEAQQGMITKMQMEHGLSETEF